LTKSGPPIQSGRSSRKTRKAVPGTGKTRKAVPGTRYRKNQKGGTGYQVLKNPETRRMKKSFLLLLLAAAPRFAYAQQFISDSALRAIVQERVATKRAMGVVVGVVEKGKAPRIQTAGVSGLSGVPLDGNTVFEIGSITKTFTGALLADMVARGEVKLEDPVAKYLPKSVRMPMRSGKQITLLDLATQSSGLPRLPNNMKPADFNNPYADYSVQQMYDFLSSYTLTRDPGATYEYSNLGVGLLGHVLSLRAGKPYEQILIERILDPLGMNDTRITLTPSMKQRMAQGFDAQGTPTRTWDLPTLAGAGALKSTANDMLKFLAANLDSTSTSIGKILASAKTARHDADRPGNSIGLAWHIVDVYGTTATWQSRRTDPVSFTSATKARRSSSARSTPSRRWRCSPEAWAACSFPPMASRS